MDSTVSFRTPVGDISAAPGAVPQADAPLGRDAGRDSALHYAAISIFGLCGVAVLAVAVGCYAVAGSDPDWPLASGLTGVGAADALDGPPPRTVTR